MKKRFFVFGLCAVFILCTSGSALAKLFIVKIDGEQIVVDFYVPEEQLWQSTPPGSPGYWEGLEWGPNPDYGMKIWYPYLEDTFDMTLKQQMRWIKQLKYAGIRDWRIGYYWDTIPLKASMFGGMLLGLPGPNNRTDFDSNVYFPPTACGETAGPGGPQYQCIYLGRTGNEDGLVTGAIINAMMGFQFPPAPPQINPRYLAEGIIAKYGMMGIANYYTLPRSEAQDHWISFAGNSNIYNDDLNGNPDDTTIGLMGPVDEVTGESPIGAWTVSDAIPQLWPANHKFHTIEISEVVNSLWDPNPMIGGIPHPSGLPAGTLIPVTIMSVMQDEEVSSKGSNKTAPDAKINGSDGEFAVVKLRAERDAHEDGRMYIISFADYFGNVFELKICVPHDKGKEAVDSGATYDSTIE